VGADEVVTCVEIRMDRESHWSGDCVSGAEGGCAQLRDSWGVGGPASLSGGSRLGVPAARKPFGQEGTSPSPPTLVCGRSSGDDGRQGRYALVGEASFIASCRPDVSGLLPVC
jgi:hypothetical protein